MNTLFVVVDPTFLATSIGLLIFLFSECFERESHVLVSNLGRMPSKQSHNINSNIYTFTSQISCSQESNPHRICKLLHDCFINRNDTIINLKSTHAPSNESICHISSRIKVLNQSFIQTRTIKL